MNKLIAVTLFLVFNSCNNGQTGNTPPAEHNLPDSISATTKNAGQRIIIFKNDSLPVKNNTTGFGYDIYNNDALYIHQPNIPAIAGNRGFSNAENAQKTANLVVYKIRHNILPPSVTKQEMDSMGVLK